MYPRTLILATALLVGGTINSSSGGSTDDLPETNYYEIVVPQGRMVIRLYDETPAHRDNFKKLVAEGFYDGTTLHRVIEGFMIQGGDPNSKDDDPYNDGMGDPGYTLPAEFVRALFHKRGALAAARTGDHMNPKRRSSGSQFYIVHGTTFDDATLDIVARQIQMTLRDNSFNFSEEMRAVYRSQGGAPNLDGQYTVFGEVVEGLDVLDAVAAVPTPGKLRQRTNPQITDRPLDDIALTIRPLPEYAAKALN
ncbi:MAG: peptidylprolyl isomerase [Rhodothermales bacterium]